jgi:putative ABC transport system permease protein
MNLFRLALRNIAGNSFRSFVVLLCALLIAGMGLTTGMILLGAENSLRLAMDRLGADIIVVPEGAADRIESALLMGRPTQSWMPASIVERVAAAMDVQAVSPQLYLATLSNASCCTVSDMFLIAYDPRTDFVVTPWLEKTIGGELRLGEVIGGTDVLVPAGEERIKLYGYPVALKAKMEPTGTGLDRSLFLTIETAQEMAHVSRTKAEKPLEIPQNSVSAVMVKVRPGSNPRAVALNISVHISGVTPILSPDMFQSQRKGLTGLRNGMVMAMILTVGFSVLLIGLVFSMAANERRRELGVLRALGATRSFIFRVLLSEAGLLALYGGIAGAALTILAVVLFRKLIIATLGIPFLVPALPMLAALILGGLACSLLTVTLAAMLPAYRISHEDPSIAMRE